MTEPARPARQFRPVRLSPGHVHRPRLTDQILSAGSGSTCVISSAPGYGATSAVLRAVKSRAEVTRWVRVDERIQDGAARARLGQCLGADPDHGPVPIEDLVARLSVDPPTWLVIDGVDPDRHRGLVSDLAGLSRDLPEQVRLIITAHGRLPAVTVACGGRALVLDESDLRFDSDEAIQLLLSISPDIDIDMSTPILQLAQGWAAALVAAATEVRTHGDPEWLARSGPAALLHEWFNRLPAVERDFLQDTSVLDLLGSGVTAAVTGRTDAGAILLSLETRRAFLTEVTPPPGYEGRWWSRHPLLTLMLQHLDSPDRAERHSRAAQWFEAMTDVDRTMHHLIAAGRNQDAGAFLTRHESDLLTAGLADKVLQWYECLPGAWSARVTHLLRVGWGRALSGDIRGADAALARLRTDLGAAMEPAAEPRVDPIAITGEVSLLQAYLASFHADPGTMVSAGRTAMADLAGRPPPIRSSWRRCWSFAVCCGQADTKRHSCCWIASPTNRFPPRSSASPTGWGPVRWCPLPTAMSIERESRRSRP